LGGQIAADDRAGFAETDQGNVVRCHPASPVFALQSVRGM
jgi:hypothetical protein